MITLNKVELWVVLKVLFLLNFLVILANRCDGPVAVCGTVWLCCAALLSLAGSWRWGYVTNLQQLASVLLGI